MRLTNIICSNYFKRYIERELHKGKSRQQWHPLTGWKEIKRREFDYNEHRPWTDEFKMNNPLGKKPKKAYVQPLKQWNIFKGDRVEILVGHDKGRQGIVNSIIKERNWVFVEGLNNKFTSQSTGADMLPICRREEQPLLVTSQVILVDPSDNRGTEVEWRFTEEGEPVRVSTRTGRLVPLPEGYTETEDLVIPAHYSEGPKDTKDKELTATSYNPRLSTFAEDIMEEMGITEDRKPKKTYWY